MLIDPQTFQAVGEPKTEIYGVVQPGTVEVTLRSTTVRLPAFKTTTEYRWQISVYSGLTGRYRTGTKAWPARISLHSDNRETIFFGRDDRTHKFQKEHHLSFTKEYANG